MKNLITKAVFALALIAAVAAPLMAAPATNTLGHNIGATRYDVVSYFPEGGGTPQQGLIGISHDYKGVTYRFRTKKNLDLFKKNPAKYAPQYNGWCTWAMAALDKEVDIEPTKYLIRNGKLYLFYNDPELDTRALMLKDADNLFRKADANWKKRLGASESE